VASRLSGIPELVIDGQTGILTEPGDASGIADALVGLAADPSAREIMGRKARSKVEEEFSLSESVSTLRRLIWGMGARC
jgi:glycosyltransferase involved in cell wall biosynthesis